MKKWTRREIEENFSKSSNVKFIIRDEMKRIDEFENKFKKKTKDGGEIIICNEFDIIELKKRIDCK